VKLDPRVAPPDPGIKPNSVRDRAMRAVLRRGPQPEDKEQTRASQEYWAALKRGMALAQATGPTAPHQIGPNISNALNSRTTP